MNKYLNIFISKKTFTAISLLLLTFSFYFNVTLYTTNDNIKEIDPFSDGIMISDLMYNNHFTNESLFQKAINSEIKFKNNLTGTKEEIYLKYINNETYDEDVYITYQSNITAHRAIYNTIDNMLQNNKIVVIYIIEFLNALFLSSMITIILLWIKKIFFIQVSYILLFLIAFTYGRFVPFATNLYWITGSMFLPMASSILVLYTRNFTLSKRHFITIFAVAFMSCFMKQLFYFEFVSSIMVSMMIPYIYYVFSNKLKFKDSVKLFTIPTIGALMSFVTVCLIKVIMLSKNYSIQEAINLFFGNISYRLVGDNSYYSFAYLFNDMLSFDVISIKKIITLTESELIIISIILITISYIMFESDNNYFESNEFSFFITTLISIIAPISWFILAKPHSFIHEWLVVVLWYLPFNILISALDIYIIIKIYKKVIENKSRKTKIKKSKLKKNKIFALVLCIGLCTLTKYASMNITEYKNLNIPVVYEDGLKVYDNDGINITYYNGSLYYISKKSISHQFFLHIIPVNISDIDDYSRSMGFENYDFNFNESKIIEPYKINGKEFVKIDLPIYEISKIVTGQYELKENKFNNLWEYEIDLSSIFSFPKGYTFSPFNLNDENWQRGISNDGIIILLPGNNYKFKVLKGKNISINGDTFTVNDVIFVTQEWTHLILDRSLNTDIESLEFTID